MELYVPFAHDAAVAMAHGLHRLLYDEKVKVASITAKKLSEAIQKSKFAGTSGEVSFLKNGDRNPDGLDFVVYNCHASARKFQKVGQMKYGLLGRKKQTECVTKRCYGRYFTPCRGAGCPRIIFSDGSDRVPNVNLRVSDHNCVCLFLMRRL